MLNISPEHYNRFYLAMKFVIDKEVGPYPNGGYTNDPDDPGGETKWGISAAYHPDEDIKNMTKERALEIYFDEYWVPAGCDTLPSPLCIVVFDTAVNMGVSNAVAYLKASDWDYKKYLQLRKEGYAERVKKKPAKQKYLQGWLNRVNDLDKLATLVDQENRSMLA